MTTTADTAPDTDIESDDTTPAAAPASAGTKARAERSTRDPGKDAKPSVLARFGRPVLLLVVALALAAAGALFLVRADDLDSGTAVTNEAVIDPGATSTVIGQVSTALNQVLSYDYRKPQVAKAAAAKWLTGDAPAQYKVLFAQLQQLAPGQKLTLVAKVSTAGVVSLTGDTARLLVFIDQQSTRASDNQSSVSAAQVQITAVRRGGLWQISELKPI